MSEIISEAYRIRNYEESFANRLRPIMHDLGAWRAKDGSVSMNAWKRHDHKIVISDHRDASRRNEVVFYEHLYDPRLSEIVYGTPVAVEKIDSTVKIDGFSRTFGNRDSTQETQEKISERIQLSRSVEHSFAQGYSFNIENETEVSGSYSGVTFQNKMKVAFGTTFDKTETESESKDVEQLVEHSVTVPPGKLTLVSFEKNSLVTETPFTVKGYLDCKLWLNFEDWSSQDLEQGHLLFGGWHKGAKEFRFDSILDFERFLKGYDVDYPQMAAYPTHASQSSLEAMDWIFNPDNRVIEATGVKRRVFENNVNITTQELD